MYYSNTCDLQRSYVKKFYFFISLSRSLPLIFDYREGVSLVSVKLCQICTVRHLFLKIKGEFVHLFGKLEIMVLFFTLSC